MANKRLAFIFSIYLISSGILFAQNKLSLTLQEAIDLGLKNRAEIKNQEVSMQLAENELGKIKSKNLPQVNAIFDSRVNTQLQTQVLSPQAIGGLSTDPIKAKFGTKYYNVFAVSATQNIFSSFIQGDRKINVARVELERANLEKLKIDLKLSIAEDYYDALLKKEKADLSDYNVKQAHQFFLQGQGQLKSGSILQTDLDLLELNEMNAVNSHANEMGDYTLSLNNLINHLGLPMGSLVELTELIPEVETGDTTRELKLDNRIEIKQERSEMTVNELSLRKQKMSYWPTVSLYGNYTLQQYNNSFDPVNGQLWNPYNYFGLKVDLPVFDGFTKERNKQEFEYRMRQNRNNINKLESDLNYELQSTNFAYTNSFNIFRYSKKSYELAKKVTEVGKVRFMEGAITPAEFENLKYSMKNAQANYISSLYNYLIARIRLLKARGDL